MKTTPLLICLLSLAPLQLPAQFEGVVESKNLTTDETGVMQQYVMTMWVKGEMVKIVIPPAGQTPGTTMIYRRDRKMMWMLDEKEKTYFEVMLSDQGDKEAKPSEGVDVPPVPKVTGKKKPILGYPCDQILLKNGDIETEFWGTKQLAGLTKAITRVFSGMSADQSAPVDDEITKMGYFPLLARTRLEGRILESSEVTRIDARQLAPELFDLPTGYRKEGVKDRLQKEGVQ